MNVLVTGANGFIGSNIVTKLRNNSKFTVFCGTRTTINLLSTHDVQKYIEDNKIDSIIHCAIEGGSRLKKDDGETFYRNILMYENLIKSNYKLFINLASGAEFDRINDINNMSEADIFVNVPKDYYGLSKNIISKSLTQFTFGHNLRIFGCFYHNELDTRFIKNNIKNYINKKPITIHQDKYMDYLNNKIKDCVSDYLKNVVPIPFQLKQVSTIRFNRYQIGTNMKMHHDHIHGLFDGEKKGVPILTILALLNDDFEGGDFLMFDGKKVQLEAGDIILFPSNFLYPHAVTTVTKGTRYSFVSWGFWVIILKYHKT